VRAGNGFHTFLSVDRDSKLIINSRTAKHTREEATAFLFDLKARVTNRINLTTDGWITYGGRNGAVQCVFGDKIDYATETKRYASIPSRLKRLRRISPLEVISVRKTKKIGEPDMELATTCHCERTNLSVRLFNRRFTRLTLGFSKKLENLRYSVALFIAHFNFCRVHSSHKKTPAMAAELTNHVWTIEELLAEPI
jgi:IS1 family transposase